MSSTGPSYSAKNAFSRAAKTPFRYPGGKAVLAQLLREKIGALPEPLSIYAEPYAGGAGAAFELLATQTVKKIVLNDFDRRIFLAWTAIIHDSARFIDRIRQTSVDLPTW